MMTSVTRPTFRTLDRIECEAVLSLQSVGRIAFSHRDHVDIEPISYVVEGDWIFGRTADGSKLQTLAHHPWVAFEADDVRGQFEWESVVVKGPFHRLEPTGSPIDRATFDTAREAIQRHMPTAFTANDPVPERTVVFGISMHEVTGRAATTRVP